MTADKGQNNETRMLEVKIAV